MDINAYISSGILEQYCLGFISDAERAEVERNAALYPAISIEIAYINASMEQHALNNGLQPSRRVKYEIMRRTYEQESGAGKKFPPLVNDNSNANDIIKWLGEQTIAVPPQDFDNLYSIPLPSTDAVINFMLWARVGIDEEEHEHYNEFVVIIEGQCDMYMDGEKKHYQKGDIIRIPAHVPHYALISSDTPMVAVVQRQMTAA